MTLNVSTAAVRVDGLSRRYGAIRALDAVDLTLERGITGLLGPNGAGKTTLLSILATVSEPDAGMGDDELAPRRRRKQASLPDGPTRAPCYPGPMNLACEFDPRCWNLSLSLPLAILCTACGPKVATRPVRPSGDHRRDRHPRDRHGRPDGHRPSHGDRDHRSEPLQRRLRLSGRLLLRRRVLPVQRLLCQRR